MKLKRVILSDFMFFIVISLLTLISVFSYQRIHSLSEQSDWVNHSNLIKLKLQQILVHITDRESRLRYFLITRDSSYILPKVDEFDRNQKDFARLDSLTHDNVVQQINYRTLLALTKKRLQQLKAIDSLSASGTGDLKGLILEGKNIMDVMRTTITDMNREENRLLVDRRNNKDYAARITPLISLLLSVFFIFIICLTYFILRIETRLRFHVQDSIKKLNDYFKDLPALFAILKGPDHRHELTNALYQEISGNRELTGKSYHEAFPELAGQGFYELLDKVYKSGELFIGTEMPVTVKKENGKLAKRYFNFVYQPVFNNKRETEGILIFGYEITEMIVAREKVEETEQRSRLAIEAANIGTFDWDMEHQQFDSSPRAMEIFGFDKNENATLHVDLLNRFHPDDRPVRDKAIEDAKSTGSLGYEARIIWPDKSVHWVNVYGKILHNEVKDVSRMYGTIIDVTKPKTILEELRESEAKFRLLADSMPQFVWTSDVQGNLDYFNRAVLDYSGLTLEAILKKGWVSIVHPDDQDEHIKKWMNAIITGEEFICEHRFRNAAGIYRWHLSRALPQKDHYGDIQRWVGTSTDIHDQKNHSQMLEQQISERTQQLSELNKSLVVKNNIFAQAEENALIGSYSWNLQSGELEYSDNLFRLFGFEPNEFLPSFEKYHSLIHPEDKEQVMKDGMATMERKQQVGQAFRIITKDGAIKHFRATGKIMGEGENLMLIGTVQDISQDTLLNEILRVKNLQLERTNAELESFNYIASHDLQEPLRKIQAFSQRILQREGNQFSSFTRDYFVRITASAARMQNLINALLSYSRADAAIKEFAPVDLGLLVENVKAELQDMIDEKNAVVEYDELPVMLGVNIQLHQLFMNLVSNALKYSRIDVAPHVKITAVTVKGEEINDTAADKKLSYCRISVADNGIGFEQEYEHKIFELFQRLHNSENYAGTGIGLAICKKIMRNHQGFISATGVPGTGSIFNIYFPLSL